MREVDADLYDFLKNHETGFHTNENGEIGVHVHIDFEDMQEFSKIVGYGYFDDGGVNCNLQYDNVCVDIEYVVEYMGQRLSDYKNCFPKDDWKLYKTKILEQEGED